MVVESNFYLKWARKQCLWFFGIFYVCRQLLAYSSAVYTWDDNSVSYIRMSFVGQVCLHIRGICYSERSSTVHQNDSNRTEQKIKEQYTNRQCTKWQKHNIQYRQLCVRSDMCKFEMKNKYVGWINNCIIVLCVPRLMSSVHEMDCLREETVPVSGRSGAQSSVMSTRWIWHMATLPKAPKVG